MENRDAYLGAHGKVHYAVRTKKLPRPDTLKCVDCGEQANCYDHRDYAKPLDVDAVCGRCNRLRGPAFDRLDPFRQMRDGVFA